jgi:hypothetical protein
MTSHAPVEPLRATWIDPDDAFFAAEPLPTAASSETIYDCRGVRGATRWAPSTTAATARFVGVVEPDTHNGITETPELVTAMSEAARQDPASLSTFERVLVQSTALSVAVRAGDSPLASDAWAVVHRFASSPAVLDALGSTIDEAAVDWIGSRSSWHDRKGEQCGDGRLLLHDRLFAGARAFRPLRAGDTRALVAQLVAFDTAGQAHVTPFVGQIELRRGPEPASVCIVHLDEHALAGGAPGGLRRARVGELTQTQFVRHASEGVLACHQCHGGQGIGDFADISDSEAFSLLRNRRTAVRALAEHRNAAAMWPEPE